MIIIGSLVFTTTVPATTTTPTKTITITFTSDDFDFSTYNGYDQITTTNGSTTTEPGKPSLPAITLKIALPPNLQATAIQILNQRTQPLIGTYNIWPTQTPRTTNDDTNTFTSPDETAYHSTTPYPTQTAVLTAETDLAGQAIALITIYPIHYIPADKTLTLTTSLTITLTGTPTHTYGDYLPTGLTSTETQQRIAKVQHLVINPPDIALQHNPKPRTTGLPPGHYEYVIITKPDWVNAFQPLADWRTQCGIPTIIMTTDWIYNQSGYNGSKDQKINAFAKDVYDNWGTTYILLGGDTSTIPCNYHSFPAVDPDPVPNDTYYADFDEDWTIEVNVGRASVTGSGDGNGQIGNFINKTLAYEQHPADNFATNAAMYGFDLDNSTHVEICKQNIKDAYIPHSWNTTHVYDSESGNHRDNVIKSLNAGQNLMNHADHSSIYTMGTGSVNHGWYIDSGDMDGLANAQRQGIYYSMGCDPCAYDANICIGEHFVRNAHGGGIAFIGNSRYGWYYIGSQNGLSLKFDRLFFRSIFTHNQNTVGAALSNHKNDGISSDNLDQYIYTELTLLGDPSTPIWTATPRTLRVTYPSCITVGSSTYNVTVADSNNNPIEGATVCLWKGDTLNTEVYQVGTTSISGIVSFTVAPTTTGTMIVTVTKHNYLPYTTTANVIPAGGKLEITKIRGGLMQLRATLSNPGNRTTNNIVYTYTIQGAWLNFSGTFRCGNISSIDAGKTASATFIPFIAFGPLTVTFTVCADGIPTITKNAAGYAFLIFIRIAPS